MNGWLAARIFSCLILGGCSKGEQKSIDHAAGIVNLDKQHTPSSRRSMLAINRLTPRLITELKEKDLTFGAPVFIRIFKQERELELWVKGKERYQIFRTYKVAAMSGELGPKLKEGDRQAPEGFYHVTPARMNPNSRFHLSFNLGYPNAYDLANKRSGSALMVHGANVSIGCFAMTDPKIEEIYTLCDAALRGGQPYFRVHSFPFRMTRENMAKHKESRWFDYWKNLKTGYDWFEKHGTPPGVEVKDKSYVFGGQ